MIYRIGHRGAAGYEFGNSIASILKAIDCQVDFVEIDVQITKDGKLVVFHDHSLDKLTNGNGLLIDHSLEQLQSLRLNNGEQIITFEYLCNFCAEKKVKLLVDLKNDDIVSESISILSHYFSNTDFIISSFYHTQLLSIKEKNSQIITSIIFEGCPVDIEDFIFKTKADYISLGFESVTRKIINKIQKVDKKVLLWTVDNPFDIAHAISMNPDGIISNFPDRIPKLNFEKESVYYH